ncbi:hypothetical protein [Polynucleobacter sp.]|uniref:hypothetical protein n=1 Tax=Polynucleobacter sp. TaxID=2029855 RepID=UPI003F698DCC
MKKVVANTFKAANRREEHNRIMADWARFYSLPFLSLVYHLYNELGYTEVRIADIVNERLPEGQTITRQALKNMMKQAGLLNR